MRCPYCNALNAEHAHFCVHCKRDLTRPIGHVPSVPSPAPTVPSSSPSLYPPIPQPAQPASPQRTPVPPASAQTGYAPPARLASPTPTISTPASQTQVEQRVGRTRNPVQPVQPFSPSQPLKAPEPPAPFPPRTLAQLQALVEGALAYTFVDEELGNGRKRTIRIVYPACSQWQQVATLFKVFHDQTSDKYATLIIQGIVANTAVPYNFNNGQLRFDRDTRLGSQLVDRYIIETGTSLEMDAQRIVLTK